MACAGLHLLQPLALGASARRSALATLEPSGALARLELVGDDEEILAALSDPPAVLAVDAPLAVPNEAGQRDAEQILAWCDAPTFPVSRRRMERVLGGMRGVALAPALRGRAGTLVETLPELVLRQLAWERQHPRTQPAPGLADYRVAWLSVRAPAYRPKGAGRARPEGLAPAHDLLAGVLDLGGWAPARDPDGWQALHDAARLDALACAYLALRLHREGARGTVALGAPERGQVVVPADAALRNRVAVNSERLRAEGRIP